MVTTRRRLNFAEDKAEGTVTNPQKKTRTENKSNDWISEVTPEKGSKTVTKDKTKDSLVRKLKLVTPLKEERVKPLELFDGEDPTLYYQSGDEEQESSIYKPTYVHSNVDYHRRGDLALDQSTLKAYRFIRNNFLIPRTFETDGKFGPLSGSCFEERVIRAYSLGELEPRENIAESSLKVCTYCGEEGHMKENCTDLL